MLVVFEDIWQGCKCEQEAGSDEGREGEVGVAVHSRRRPGASRMSAHVVALDLDHQDDGLSRRPSLAHPSLVPQVLSAVFYTARGGKTVREAARKALRHARGEGETAGLWIPRSGWLGHRLVGSRRHFRCVCDLLTCHEVQEKRLRQPRISTTGFTYSSLARTLRTMYAVSFTI